jgi:ribosome biogenesis GTPase / thiamine phosphate phosphatase
MKQNKKFSEEDIKFRPKRNKTRPRTKQTPVYQDLILGIVITVDRGRFTVTLPNHEYLNIYAIKARALGRKGVVVGDRVGLTEVNFERPTDLARIVEIKERKNILKKSADDSESAEQMLVTNATQIGIVTAIENPEPQLRFIDRAIVAAFDADATPILIITKKDLKDPIDLINLYKDFDIPIVTIDQNSDLADLNLLLKNQTTVLIGASGVGKSSLVNRLSPEHTSTSAVAILLAADTWVIDTPGLRSFGLAHVHPETVLAAMPDLNAIAVNCPKACTHQDSDCEIVKVAAVTPNLQARLNSLQRILSAIKSSY